METPCHLEAVTFIGSKFLEEDFLCRHDLFPIPCDPECDAVFLTAFHHYLARGFDLYRFKLLLLLLLGWAPTLLRRNVDNLGKGRAVILLGGKLCAAGRDLWTMLWKKPHYTLGKDKSAMLLQLEDIYGKSDSCTLVLLNIALYKAYQDKNLLYI